MTDTEPTIEELRRWSAEDLMGWSIKTNYITGPHYFDSKNRRVIIRVDLWRPDDPTTGQIWMVVEKTREPRIGEASGFNFNLSWQQLPEIKIAIAQFYRISGNLEHGQGADENPCLACLKASYQARRCKL